MIIEYEYNPSNIPDNMYGYKQDLIRMIELKEKSRLCAYDSDSSGSDHSMTSFCTKNCIQEHITTRMRQKCTICTTKESQDSITNTVILEKANNTFRSGQRIFNALQLSTTRKIARKTEGIIEFYPGWFTTKHSFTSIQEMQHTPNENLFFHHQLYRILLSSHQIDSNYPNN